MRTAHFDCFSGISGDMVLGAVLAAGVPEAALRAALDSLALPLTLEVETVKRCGFAATKATVVCPDEEHYRFLPDIAAIIEKGALTPKQRDLAMAIFTKLAHAESVAHGMPLEKVHFHEVGALDSIADIVGAAVGLDLLGIDRFTCSSVPTGIGTVKGAHGLMPIPTPGTTELLKGIPIAPSTVKFELTTPTGAAILATVVDEFTDSPAMTIETIGHGAGTKDFDNHPNILRLMIGESNVESHAELQDVVTVLETNLDDCPGEIVGYTMDRLFAAGALDVFTIPIGMKKNRPGVLLSVICDASDIAAMETILFAETSTFGVRRSVMHRRKLQRESIEIPTPWGPVACKRGQRDGHVIVTPEYAAAATLAAAHSVPLRAVYDAVRRTLELSR